jgi:hypothetical protein
LNNAAQNRTNPYIGPRAFETGEILYGRDLEVYDLDNLLIAERIVLMYSPSGAGKTSLIQATLIPKLENEGFEVLPVMRVNLEPPPEREITGHVNRYIFSLLHSLEKESERLNQHMSLSELANMKLADYLDLRSSVAGGADSEVLIFDQFEEILTVDPTDEAGKKAFFSQVGEALRKRHRWALFAMREEFLAGLDPYLRMLPTRLSTTFRLDLLGEEEACQAMQKPVRQAGAEFTDTAAKMLRDDLRRVWVQQPDGTKEEQLGLYVEPVQLQVVCYRLWEKLPADDFEIGEDDVKNLGDVDSALADYYNERVTAIASETGERERSIREWFDQHLITVQGIRGLVQKEPKQTKGLDNIIISLLVDAHLVRAEERRGLTLFELSHDRLIEPVQTNNAGWREANLSTLQRRAALWETQGKPEGLLLGSQDLVEAELWADANLDQLTTVESEFLDSCRKLRAAAERERRQTWRIRLLAIGLVVSSLFLFSWLYSLWEENRPWGYLQNLSAGTVHGLRAEVVSIGRSTKDFQNQISLWPRFVSRIHLYISKNLSRAVDMRSLNGTTINGEFLLYGSSRKLEDGDVIVLADIAPFQFQSVKYFPFQFWVPSIKYLQSPSGWGMLIDDTSKTIHYLNEDTYFLSLDDAKHITLGGYETDDSILTIRRYDQGQWKFDDGRGREEIINKFTIEDRDDGSDLWVMMKTGDYTLHACKVPSGKEFHYFDQRKLQCQRILGRDDYQEEERQWHAVYQTTFCYPEKVHFRIVPIIPGLKSEDHLE